jgi:hypothetical protein
MVFGELGAFVVIVMVPVFVPVAVGLNFRLTLQLAPGTRGVVV